MNVPFKILRDIHTQYFCSWYNVYWLTINDNGCKWALGSSKAGHTQFFTFSFIQLKFGSTWLSNSFMHRWLYLACFVFPYVLQYCGIINILPHVRVRYIKVVYQYNNEQPWAVTYTGWDSTPFKKAVLALVNFTRCLRSFRKSTIHSIMLCSISKVTSFSTMFCFVYVLFKSAFSFNSQPGTPSGL